VDHFVSLCGTESVQAPRVQGVRRAHTACRMRPTNNTAIGDDWALECSRIYEMVH
jgi:hypothetical protein